ncbi:MAG: TIGR00730 family Rossman fold protein [Bacteriovoracaceae bacterium]|nr:TIGR00730 family Rossman fold protein [Bacteriovoracaceae bacterium]
MIKSICVFCGASTGNNKDHQAAAIELGSFLAEKDITLIYGGASIGLMGMIADRVLAKKGKVIGVIPTVIKDLEIAHDGLTELVEVGSMHERKQVMYDRAEAFIALPGGLGTLDEFCEVATWMQLGLHKKPIILYNSNGFYDYFISHLDKCVQEGYLSVKDRKLYTVINTTKDLLKFL